MNDTINAEQKNLKTLFGGAYTFNIPGYQRPYSWTMEEVSLLLEDLWEAFTEHGNDIYFLGSLVLVEKNKDFNHVDADVIDGQQRLTTLTILFSVLARKLKGNAHKECKKYLISEASFSSGKKSSPILNLRNADSDFFEKYIQKVSKDESCDLTKISPKDKLLPLKMKGEAQKNIYENYNGLLQMLEGLKRDNKPLKKKDYEEFFSFIITYCHLVTISTSNEESAFRIFSTMNSRGLNLLPCDILKAELLMAVEDHQDNFTSAWEKLEEEITREGVNEVFLHLRTIFTKSKQKESLVKEIKKIIKDIDAWHFLKEYLQPYVTSYEIITKNKNKADLGKEANVCLKFLRMVDVTDWIAVAIHFLKTSPNIVDKASLFFQKLERLVAYLYLTSQSATTRNARYYKILEAIDSKDFEAVLLSMELADTDKEELWSLLRGDVYTLPPRKRSYVVRRLDSFYSDADSNYDASSIEHVLPRTLPESVPGKESWEDSQWNAEKHAKWVHKLGNLVLISRSKNSEVRNSIFSEKKKKYLGVSSSKNTATNFALTTKVFGAESWNEDTVKSNQRAHLNTFNSKWELGFDTNNT